MSKSAVKVEIRHAVESDIGLLLADLRDADRVELRRSSSLPLVEMLRASFAMSDHTYAGFVDGKLVALFGVTPLSRLTGYGVPWLMSTNHMTTNGIHVLRHSKRITQIWMQEFSVLRNYVDADNAAAIKWLKWLGFDFQQSIPYGRRGEAFYPFEMRTK